VVGVAAIVFLVIHLAKGGGNNAASGTSTPGATTTAEAVPRQASTSCGRPSASASTR
jgi:hypothetical protein